MQRTAANKEHLTKSTIYRTSVSFLCSFKQKILTLKELFKYKMLPTENIFH